MPHIDLNADLGEGGDQDAEMIPLVSSANIACGGHAGDKQTMRRAIEAALVAGAAIGAHPGYEDPAHFGRLPLALDPSAVSDLVSRQIERLAGFAEQAATTIHHVKPHGALYLQADRDPALASAVVAGVLRILPGCAFYVPSGGELAIAGAAAGLRIRAEGFADRRYGPDGHLTPRSMPGAVIGAISEAVDQALGIACNQRVSTLENTIVPLTADTLCVHGDGPHAVALLRALRSALEAAGFSIRS